MIRLIAIDLDGTLLDPNGQITERSRQAVRRALERDTHVALVTARTFEEARSFADDLGLRLPLLCCHGALVKDTGTGEVYSHTPVPADCARSIVEFAERDDRLVVLNEEGKFRAARTAADKHGFGQFRQWEYFDRLVVRTEGPTAIRVIGDESVEAIAAAFPDAIGGRLSFIRDKTRTRWILSIVSSAASKVKALGDLAARLNLEPAEILAIGDGPADAPMLEYAGVGVAMGNALPAIQARADWVTRPNSADGVAVAIERFVLGERTPA